MCTSPSDILDSARRIASMENLSEGDCRAIVSRSYYAALHGVNHCFPGQINAHASNTHEQVIGKAEAYGKSLHPGRTEAKSVARDMKLFKKLRKFADYEINIDFDYEEVNNSIALSSSILNHCNIIQQKQNTSATQSL